ncbi:uncharacterized protein N7484_007633 [Penicillium longicatenatum]|uniref:uncharacterized protein n=1 Tax=Penicillium longicatenatum TaxID=1561947 RepID=UPI0025492AFF|nr:uncharacterized protein N7484_007633 [Penicillium longicatenatum]KAJ5639771.1 hypothetical protein N7484_007633 [Penicillium longicatenatum]
MTVQVVAPGFENKYPRRGDRLQEEPTAKNAQGLFPPDACIFVGNLSTKVAAEEMTEDLKTAFAVYGPCHVKIKQDKKKGLPGAFVQFEKVEHANAALDPNERIALHDRWLRIERAKGRREGTACLGLRSGAPITTEDVSSALADRGHLEVYCIESYPTGPQTWTFICKVTFAYVDDCRDAIKYFQKDPKYYLSLLDMEGSPLIPNGGRSLPLRTRPPGSSQPGRNNNHNGHPRYNKPYRNGANRGGYRGFSKYHNPPYQPENLPPTHPHGELPPSHFRGGFPGPHYWVNGLPYNNEPHPSFYHPPPYRPNDGFGNHPFIVNSQPRYDHPQLLPSPDVYNPGIPGGPLIINGQPQYGGNSPAVYHEFFTPDSGFLSPPTSITSHPGDYFTPQPFTEPEPYPTHRRYLNPPNVQVKVTMPPNMVERTGKKIIEDEGIIRLLEPEKPEKAPKLIRVYESDSEYNDEEEHHKCPTPKIELADTNHLIPVLNPVKEEYEELDVEEGHETQTTEPTSNSGPPSEDQVSTPSHASSRSRSCSPPSRIAFHVRSQMAELDSDLDEAAIQEVILSLTRELKLEKQKQEAEKTKEKMLIDRGSSTSRSCSLTRSCLSKII